VEGQSKWQARHHNGQADNHDKDNLSDELPHDRTVVAYCRDPYCVFADEAVALLSQHGDRAYRLTAGLPDWRAQGYPVAVENRPGVLVQRRSQRCIDLAIRRKA
jgi:rhodanese-related sulfurtransferase